MPAEVWLCTGPCSCSDSIVHPTPDLLLLRPVHCTAQAVLGVPLWAFVPYSCTSAVRPHLPPGTSWQRKTCRKPRRQVQMNMGILIAKLHLRPVTSYSGIANCPGERVFWAPTYPKPKWSVLAGAVFPPQNG